MKFYATSYRRCLLDDYKYVQNQLPPPKKENSVFIQQIERIHLKRDALKNKIFRTVTETSSWAGP